MARPRKDATDPVKATDPNIRKRRKGLSGLTHDIPGYRTRLVEATTERLDDLEDLGYQYVNRSKLREKDPTQEYLDEQRDSAYRYKGMVEMALPMEDAEARDKEVTDETIAQMGEGLLNNTKKDAKQLGVSLYTPRGHSGKVVID